MADKNRDGISDELASGFKKGALVGAILALSLGSLGLVLARAIMPDSAAVQAVGEWFAGASCKTIEADLKTCEIDKAKAEARLEACQ